MKTKIVLARNVKYGDRFTNGQVVVFTQPRGKDNENVYIRTAADTGSVAGPGKVFPKDEKLVIIDEGE